MLILIKGYAKREPSRVKSSSLQLLSIDVRSTDTVESSTLTLYPNDLLVYFDETGSETLDDPNYPVFGLGGCAITGDTYLTELEQPWRELKESHFGSPDKPLHASQIDTANSAGISALGDFFTQRSFARFASVFTSRTRIEPPRAQPYLAISLIVRQQIERLIKTFMFYRLVLVFESSERGNPFVQKHFSDIWPMLDMPSGPKRAPVERCFVRKDLCHPGLEVADFIVQAAGLQGYASALQRSTIRKDFEAVFAPVEGRFNEFTLVDYVTVTQRMKGG